MQKMRHGVMGNVPTALALLIRYKPKHWEHHLKSFMCNSVAIAREQEQDISYIVKVNCSERTSGVILDFLLSSAQHPHHCHCTRLQFSRRKKESDKN